MADDKVELEDEALDTVAGGRCLDNKSPKSEDKKWIARCHDCGGGYEGVELGRAYTFEEANEITTEHFKKTTAEGHQHINMTVHNMDW